MDENQPPKSYPEVQSQAPLNSDINPQIIPSKHSRGKKISLLLIGLTILLLIVFLSPLGINQYCEQDTSTAEASRCKLVIGPHLSSSNKLASTKSTPYLTILLNKLAKSLPSAKKESMCLPNEEESGTAYVLPPFSTVGWKTYTNTKYGFTFKYPEDKFSKVDDNLGKISGKFPLALFLSLHTDKPSINEATLGLNLTIIDQSAISGKQNEEDEKKEPSLPVDCEEIIIGGENAIRQPSHSGQVLIGTREQQEYTPVISTFIHNGKHYALGISPRTPADYELYDQVISTFEFLPNPTGTITATPSFLSNISTWKTFVGKNYSFKYPESADLTDNQNYTSIGLTSTSLISVQTIPISSRASLIDALTMYKGTAAELPYTKTKISGDEALELDLPTTNEKWHVHGVYVIHDKNLYIIKVESVIQQEAYTNSKIIFDNLLSTFTFVN